MFGLGLVLPPVDPAKVGTLRNRAMVLGLGLVLPTVEPAKVPLGIGLGLGLGVGLGLDR